jgi:hypothetical protein
MVALLVVPLGERFGQLSLELLYSVTLTTSALSVLFDAAYPAYLVTERFTVRRGLAREMRWSVWVSTVSRPLIPLADAPPWLAFDLINIPQLGDAANTIYDVAALSAHQLITSSNAMGRVVAGENVARGAGALLGLEFGANAGAELGARRFGACYARNVAGATPGEPDTAARPPAREERQQVRSS